MGYITESVVAINIGKEFVSNNSDMENFVQSLKEDDPIDVVKSMMFMNAFSSSKSYTLKKLLKLILKLLEELRDDFEINPYFTTTNNDEDLILYFGVRGKLYWDYYKSYENLIDFLQESNIDIKNYGFISIGEEYEDVQFYGYYYDYGLEYNRSITIE